jgi:predicted Zn-dependent peptidase
MNYKLHTLDSGLRVMTVPVSDLKSVTVAVWVKTGSRNEEKKVNGISHFLEHMVFKGSAKRPTAREISTAVDEIGGEFNAATSKDWTNFYIKSASSHVETAFDVLSDMVLAPILKPAEIEKEKGTIIQEIAMYEDTPIMHIADVFENLIFNGSSLGWDTAGTASSVKSITKNDFLRYRKMHYYPENMLVSVVGGVSEKEALTLSRKYFGKIKSQSESEFKTPEFRSEQIKPEVILKTKKSDQAHLMLGFRGEGRNYPGRYAQAVLAVVLGGGMSSRLFLEVRERRGLAYSVRTSFERYQETGYLGTYAGVNPQRVEEALKIILEEHKKIADGKFPVTSSELKKAKEYLKGHFALALEDTKDISGFYADQILFLPEVKSPAEVTVKIDKVTLNEVQAEAKKLFTPSGLNLAVIGNYTNVDKFKYLLK